jgi:hypothetical protein
LVKQVRIRADRTLEKESIVEHPFGRIKRAMDGGIAFAKGRGRRAERLHYYFSPTT